MIGQSLLSQMLPASRDIRYGQGQNQGQMMGGGGDGRSSNPGWDAMSNAEKAAFYSDNPTMAGIAKFGQKALNYAPFGVGLAIRAQEAMFPQFVADQQSVARGIDPATGLQVGGYGSRTAPDLQSFDIATPTPTGLYGDQFAGEAAPKSSGFMDTLGRMFGGSSVSLGPVEVQDRTPSLTPAGIEAANIAGGYGNNEGYGAGFGGPDTSNSFGEGQYNQGGMVNAQHLMGRAPAPDDGYGALQGGEYVITKAAVERYGKAMMDAINNGTFR